MTWDETRLKLIANTDDLKISPFRDDGVTYGTPTWIWSVVVDRDLYVRGYNGKKSRRYQAAVHQTAGRISAAGMTIEVSFDPVDGAINDRIDDAYRANQVRQERLSGCDDRRTRPVRHSQNHTQGLKR